MCVGVGWSNKRRLLSELAAADSFALPIRDDLTSFCESFFSTSAQLKRKAPKERAMRWCHEWNVNANGKRDSANSVPTSRNSGRYSTIIQSRVASRMGISMRPISKATFCAASMGNETQISTSISWPFTSSHCATHVGFRKKCFFPSRPHRWVWVTSRDSRVDDSSRRLCNYPNKWWFLRSLSSHDGISFLDCVMRELSQHWDSEVNGEIVTFSRQWIRFCGWGGMQKRRHWNANFKAELLRPVVQLAH